MDLEKVKHRTETTLIVARKLVPENFSNLEWVCEKLLEADRILKKLAQGEPIRNLNNDIQKFYN